MRFEQQANLLDVEIFDPRLDLAQRQVGLLELADQPDQPKATLWRLRRGGTKRSQTIGFESKRHICKQASVAKGQPKSSDAPLARRRLQHRQHAIDKAGIGLHDGIIGDAHAASLEWGATIIERVVAGSEAIFRRLLEQQKQRLSRR